jgi:hypothetical protein
MGLLPDIRSEGYLVRDVRVVGRNGNQVAGFPVDSVARIANGRYISIPRGETGGFDLSDDRGQRRDSLQ